MVAEGRQTGDAGQHPSLGMRKHPLSIFLSSAPGNRWAVAAVAAAAASTQALHSGIVMSRHRKGKKV